MTRKRPAQTPVARQTDELDRRLLETLAAHQGPAGICPRIPRLARLLGVHVSTIQRSLRRLEAAGLVASTPVYERDDDLEWKRRLAAGFTGERPRRQTANSYVLLPGPGRSGFRESAGQTPVARDSVRPLEGKEQAGGGYQGSRDEDELDATWPAYADYRWYSGPGRCGTHPPRAAAASGEPVELAVEPPAAFQLDHDPGQAEIVATLEQGFGAVQVEQVYPNQLAGSVAAFHQAADRLDRATCWGNGDVCQPGRRCRRHTRRERT